MTATRLAILGGGPAGYVAAIRAAQLGAAVTIIEERELGGVCLNRGCIPSKALLRSAEVRSLILRSGEFGVPAETKVPDWQTVFSRKERIVKGLRLGVEHLMIKNRIAVVRGTGRLLDSRRIEVSGPDGTTLVTADRIIIATGSRPAVPPIPGLELPGVMTTDEALELEASPRSAVIIGAGAVGAEFATFFNAMGVNVTVIEMANQMLPGTDSDIAAEVLKSLKRRGVTVKLSSKVLRLDRGNNGIKVTAEGANGAVEATGDIVLLAAGRRLRSDEAGILELGITCRQGAISVDDHLQTSVEGVYAAGDVIGGQLLAHVAFAEGRTAAENALGRARPMDYSAVPACIYSSPEVATVGLSESVAAAQGRAVRVGRFDFRANGKALGLGERDGFVKILVDPRDGRVLGGHIVGPDATDLISELSLAVRLGAPAEALAELIHPHPTLSEAVMEAAADAIGRAIHK